MTDKTDLFGQGGAPSNGQAATIDPGEPDTIDVEAEAGDKALALAEERPQALTIKEQMETAMQRAQDTIQFFSGLRTLIISNSRPKHWIRFGNRIRPDGSECLRLRTLLNIEMEIAPPERYDYEDEKGQYYEYRCTGRATLGPMSIPCYGAASSRTKFFAKAHDEYVDPREINPSFIGKMAWMDCLKKGVGGLLALDIDPNELKGITGEGVQDQTRQFDHSKGDDEDTAGERGFIRTAILELAGHNNGQAAEFLEYLTTFTAKDGRRVKGKKTVAALTQKQVANLYKRRNQDLSQANFAKFRENQGAVNGPIR